MTETISADAVKIAGALVAQIDEHSDGFLTDEQKQTYRSLQTIKDSEERSAKTMEIMERLIADAKSVLEADQNVKQQSEAISGQFSPEAQEEIRRSASEFEGRLRSDAQAELRSLTAEKKSSGMKRNRLRI